MPEDKGIGIGVPEGLKELSSAAVRKQVVVNEAFETLHLADAHFLRLYNGGSTDVEFIREHASRVREWLAHLDKLLIEIEKPYLD